MTQPLRLTIARVDAPVFYGEVVSVNVPGTEGDMTLLSGHVPLVSALRAGTIGIVLPNLSRESFDITAGTLELSHNHVTILL